MRSRTAKSCGRGAATLALSWWSDPLTTVARKPVHRREHEVSRNTVAQGRPDVRLLPVVHPGAFLLHPDRGCGQHPAFPVPLLLKEGSLLDSSGAIGVARTLMHFLDIIGWLKNQIGY